MKHVLYSQSPTMSQTKSRKIAVCRQSVLGLILLLEMVSWGESQLVAFCGRPRGTRKVNRPAQSITSGTVQLLRQNARLHVPSRILGQVFPTLVPPFVRWIYWLFWAYGIIIDIWNQFRVPALLSSTRDELLARCCDVIASEKLADVNYKACAFHITPMFKDADKAFKMNLRSNHIPEELLQELINGFDFKHSPDDRTTDSNFLISGRLTYYFWFASISRRVQDEVSISFVMSFATLDLLKQGPRSSSSTHEQLERLLGGLRVTGSEHVLATFSS